MYGDSVGSVAILSSYKAQVRAMRALFLNRLGAQGIAGMAFATIDGFQVGTPLRMLKGSPEAQGQSQGRHLAESLM